MLTVIIFSKLISLIYFNLFIEDFELLMLVSSLIYLAFLAFFCTGNKSCYFKKLWPCSVTFLIPPLVLIQKERFTLG